MEQPSHKGHRKNHKHVQESIKRSCPLKQAIAFLQAGALPVTTASTSAGMLVSAGAWYLLVDVETAKIPLGI